MRRSPDRPDGVAAVMMGISVLSKSCTTRYIHGFRLRQQFSIDTAQNFEVLVSDPHLGLDQCRREGKAASRSHIFTGQRPTPHQQPCNFGPQDGS